MIKSQIETFIRLKPPTSLNTEDTIQFTSNNSTIEIYLPEESKKSYINNNKKVVAFKFSGVFESESSQDTIYDNIGPKLIKNALNGYNSTIFCYGQTSSGKTFTMSGGKQWKERGLIPRFLLDLFKSLKLLEKTYFYEVYISYLEIYNENAYDLLETNTSNDIEKWKKIIVYEDNSSNIVMKNLSTIKVLNEQQALDLFMTGNYNRQVTSTPMNMASSRSHAVFTIILEGRKLNSETIIASKINLVDLAGSERLNKSNLNQLNSYYNYFVDTTSMINETKYINLSLSFLEQVIIALNEKSKNNRIHVPYRNSLMTTILKDSLGGNCRTCLIANCSTDLTNIDETLSTLRFAVRCSKIENEVTVNSHMDLNILVSKLNSENNELKLKIVNLLKEKEEKGSLEIVSKPSELSDYEKDECKVIISDYIFKKTPDLNVKNNNQLFYIVDYLIDYINSKEKLFKDKLKMIADENKKNKLGN